MRALRVVALVLGPALFIPVSCTSALYAGIDVIAYLDAKEVARGDQVHPTFSIVVAPGDKGEPFRSMSLSEFKLLREAGQPYSVLMPAPSGRINVDDGYLSYRVLENQGSVQVIEVEDKIDVDRQTWSRYRATSTDVAPLASRMRYFGYLFAAMPLAFGAALLLYGVGRYLRKKLRVADGASRP